MVVCRNDGVVGLTSLSNKEMTERSFRSQKVVVISQRKSK